MSLGKSILRMVRDSGQRLQRGKPLEEEVGSTT